MTTPLSTINLADRPSFREIFIEMAHLVAKRSTCSRLQVGTVITSIDFRSVFSFGYNGNATGFHNMCDDPEDDGNCGCIHSEENAIINCTVSRDTPKIFFITHMPCKMCAKKIVNLGNVRSVYYAEPYRKTEGVAILKKADIIILPANIFLSCTQPAKAPEYLTRDEATGI